MKKLLIVVDYQNDFVDGSLGFNGAEKLDSKIADLVNEFKNNNDEVVYTLDTHNEDYLNTLEGKNLPVAHCIKGTSGHALYGKTAQSLKDCRGFEKETFGSKELYTYLLDKDYSEIYLVGLVSNICVLSNAILVKSIFPNRRIVVLKDYTGSNDLVMQEKGFDILKNLHIELK